MASLIIGFLYGCFAAAAGAGAAWWLAVTRFRRQIATVQTSDGQAAEVLTRLHDLATRVAIDVDDHQSQVQAISETLTAAADEPASIVDVVAKLVEANQQMQAKLSSTENQLREQAQQMQAHVAEARTDALTLLANRRAFDDELARRISEFQRQGRIFSLTMLDVDHFKTFNDTHGHQAGDEVLRGVARVLRRKMREMDIVARYGGEEFAIVHPGTTCEDACRAAMRACQAIEKTPFFHNGETLRVTVSMGVAEMRSSEKGAALIARADRALYARKQVGRNGVHWHDGFTAQPFVAARAAAVPEPSSAETTPAARTAAETSVGSQSTAADEAPRLRLNPAVLSTNTLTIEPLGRTIFCQQVRSRMAEWKRGGPIFSIILAEIDNFDQSGGPSGQEAREMATQAIRQYLAGMIREMDVLGAYSPGCFAVILPTARITEALRVAERIRENFPLHTSPAPGEEPGLTLSVGVVQALESDDSAALLKRAETALDAADRRGGNTCFYHDGDRCAPITAMLETMGYLA